MQSTISLNTILIQRPSILQLFTCKNQSLLIRWNSLRLLDQGFQVLKTNIHHSLNLNCFSCQCLYIENSLFSWNRRNPLKCILHFQEIPFFHNRIRMLLYPAYVSCQFAQNLLLDTHLQCLLFTFICILTD